MDALKSECNVKYDNDALFEILLRLAPRNMFRCILVSKDWLSVIADPLFRTNYLNKWKYATSSQVVGLLRYDKIQMMNRRPPRAHLFPMTNLGRAIAKSMPRSGSGFGYFISISPKGGLLLFGGVDPTRFYVCKPSSRVPPVELPPPPVVYEYCMANILCDDDDGVDYKVILAKGFGTPRLAYEKDNRLSIQILCSRTGKWEQSMLTCSTRLSLAPEAVALGGIVDASGIIYWKAWKAQKNCGRCLVAWDVNGGSRITSVIKDPLVKLVDNDNHTHAASPTTFYASSSHPQCSLLAATCTEGRNFGVDDTRICIWGLDDNVKDWHMLHSVWNDAIWGGNEALLKSNMYALRFVSFIPGKSDSAYVGWDSGRGQLFVCNFDTGKLEQVKYLNIGIALERVSGEDIYHPLTIQNLGVWPSSLKLL